MSMLFSSYQIRKAYQLFIGKQAASMALSFGSAVLIARQIGPSAYGAYFISITLIEYLLQACQFGMVPLLYREKSEKFRESYNTFFVFTVTVAFVLSALVFAGIFFYPFSDPESFTAVKWVIFSLPLFVANSAFKLALEKELRSKDIVSSEILAHVAFLLVGSVLAFLQKGLWAPVLGWWAQNLVFFLLLLRSRPSLPNFHSSWNLVRPMLKSGTPIVGVSLISGLEGLSMSALTSSKLGLSSTGEIGLVKKIIARASFLQAPNVRISNIVCGNHVSDSERLKNFTEKNLFSNTLAFGCVFLALAWTPNIVFEKLLGSNWGGSSLLLPWLCFATFTTSSLYVFQAGLIALEEHRPRLFLATGSLLVLVVSALGLMPRFGMRGWAMAESLASFVWLGLPVFFGLKVGRIRYRSSFILWALFGALILVRAAFP
ncbi:hypothetical protein EBT16_10715 [bacterium]|nr:hypothetical protein [bacterium]